MGDMEKNFLTKGIFGLGQDGLSEPLDLSCSGPLGSSYLSSGIIKEPTLAYYDNGDAQKYQVSSRPAKKINLSTGSDFDTNSYQKNKTITGNDSIKNSSISLEESVFSIGHILELIVSELDRKTLLACRLVSRRWSYFTSKALQKIVNILMVHKVAGYFDRKEAPHYYFHANQKLYLEDLLALVSNSPEFPCTSFSFKNKNQDELSPSAESFFEAHGSMIKKITLNGWVSLSDVKQLLFTQAPNLQQISLIHLLRNEVDPPVMNYAPLEEKAETKNVYHFDASIIPPRPTLGNLKVFKCDAHIPQMFVQHVLEWSPNLVEAELPVEYFHLLIKPKNRLYLLKKVDTDIGSDEIVEGLESVAKYHENNLTLKEIHFRHILPSNLFFDFYSRAVVAMCKIWEASSATCQKLSLDYCFDFDWVCGMPELKSLSFYDYDDGDDLSPLDLFEQWSSMGDKFPKLTTLNIRIEAYTAVDHFFQGRVTAQVLSVKDVYFSHGPQEIVLQSFKEMFPNAALHPFTRQFKDEADTVHMMCA